MPTSRSPFLLARAEALFASPIPTGSRPDRSEVAAAVRGAVRDNGGVRGCAAAMAFEYGDHPEPAVLRMQWALHVIESTYQGTR